MAINDWITLVDTERGEGGHALLIPAPNAQRSAKGVQSGMRRESNADAQTLLMISVEWGGHAASVRFLNTTNSHSSQAWRRNGARIGIRPSSCLFAIMKKSAGSGLSLAVSRQFRDRATSPSAVTPNFCWVGSSRRRKCGSLERASLRFRHGVGSRLDLQEPSGE
jgi:hypothetical protein